MTTLAEHIIVAGAENPPPILEKTMYDSWTSCIRLFIKDPLALVANSQTLYNPSQSLQHSALTMYPPPQQFTPVYAAPIHHRQHHNSVNLQQHSISSQSYLTLSVTQQPQDKFPQMDSGLAVPVFQQGKDPIDYINKALTFMSIVASSSKRPRNSTWFKEKLMLVEAQEADLDAYDSDCDDLSSAKAVLMANLSSCDLDVFSKVPYFDSYPNDMINQDVPEMLYSEHSHNVNFPDNEINSDINIIPYSQYL
nr:hypothetical protein [Tanacetum cinerariifolium]